MENRKEECYGAVTVFFTLIFLMVLSVILTCLEGARVSAVQTCVYQAMSSSMDSILADYYGPLFEEYQIFGRYEEMALPEQIGSSYEENLLKRMKLTFSPREGMPQTSVSYFQVLQADLTGMDVNHLSFLTTNGGEAFYHQAADAMKDQMIGSAMDELLKKCKQVEKQNKVGEVFEMQAKEQEKLAVIDQTVLKLMEKLDGISISKGRIVWNSDGRLRCHETFAKKYVSFPISKESVKINHEKVFSSIQQLYESRDQWFSTMSSNVDQLKEVISQQRQVEADLEKNRRLQEKTQAQIHSYDEAYSENAQSMMACEAELVGLFLAIPPDADAISACERAIEALAEERESINDAVSGYLTTLRGLREEESELNSKQKSLKKQRKNLKTSLTEEQRTKLDQMRELQAVLKQAVDLTEEGTKAQNQVAGSVTEYGNWLSSMKDTLEQRVYESFEDELKVMKRYLGKGEGGDPSLPSYDFTKMKQTLEIDEGIATRVIEGLQGITFEGEEEALAQVKNQLTINQQIFQTYSIEGLELDYSSLNTNTVSDDVMEKLSGVISEQLLDQVVEDPKSLSKKTLDKTSLPSTLEFGDEGMVESLASKGLLETLKSMIQSTALSDLFHEVSQVEESENKAGTIFEDAMDGAMFQFYLKEYFKCYLKDEDPMVETVKYPSVLDYEKEYLCFHHEQDQENLLAMVTTMVLVRLLPNLISLVSDKVCNAKALETATSLLSFTGMPILIELVKMLILVVWAFEESVVDSAILLQGKSVELLLPVKHHMQYEELLTFQRTLILEKAKNYKEPVAGIAIRYEQYLFFFLLLQSNARKSIFALDLIQANLNLRYEGGFQAAHCVEGFTVDGEYEIKNRLGPGALFTESRKGKQEVSIAY